MPKVSELSPYRAVAVSYRAVCDSEPATHQPQTGGRGFIADRSGYLNKEIAEQLNISLNTVLTHRKNIIKTGIRTVSGLTFYSLRNGLVSMQRTGLCNMSHQLNEIMKHRRCIKIFHTL